MLKFSIWKAVDTTAKYPAVSYKSKTLHLIKLNFNLNAIWP